LIYIVGLPYYLSSSHITSAMSASLAICRVLRIFFSCLKQLGTIRRELTDHLCN
jgi:hypothetical protein